MSNKDDYRLVYWHPAFKQLVEEVITNAEEVNGRIRLLKKLDIPYTVYNLTGGYHVYHWKLVSQFTLF